MHPTDGSDTSEDNSTKAMYPEKSGKGLIREPLLHFVILGAIMFGLYAYLNGSEGVSEGDQPIIVTEGKIEHLAALFTRTWQRPPTRQELEGLVDDYVREEAAYREGTSLGLDRNDTIIRRRIRQKLDFVADDLASQIQPTDEDLATYLSEHPDDFRIPARFSFRQVFFDPQKHDDSLPETIKDLIASLQADPSIKAEEQGDRTLLEFRYENVSQREVASLFGTQFADQLIKAEAGTWQGPVQSSYGLHAVIIDDLSLGSVPQLESVKDAVHREWEHERRQELTAKFYEGLIDKYDVVIEWPESEQP